MHGSKCLPKNLVEPLHDRIVGDEMGHVKLTPPVDEKISDLAKRTTIIGEKFITANGGKVSESETLIAKQEPVTQPAELFALGDLMKFWNAEWKLERAGFGGAGGGVGNIRGITHLEDDILATWPREIVRGVVLRREMQSADKRTLSLEAGADAGRAWELEIYANNKRVYHKLIDGAAAQAGERVWEKVNVALGEFSGEKVQLRLYQGVRLADKIPGNAYWKNLVVK
jgi:hypothetical protein